MVIHVSSVRFNVFFLSFFFLRGIYMEGYIRSRKIDILFFSFFSFLFKIIDRGILGVLRRTREECRFLGVVIVRFIQKARHSEDPRWRGYFPVT